MPIIERRVFYGKMGNGEPLIKHLQEGNEVFARFGLDVKARLLSDHNSGRTDRVVAEWQMESPTEMEDALEQAMSDPQTSAEFTAWVEKLNSLIHYAEVEHWHLH